MRRVVVLQSYQDVTDDIKKQLLNNELDELIIKFEANCQLSKIENRIFDSNQEEINFNITFEDSIKTANCLFNKLSRLKTFGKNVNISGNGVVSAELMFGSCEKLLNLPVLVFPKLISADEMFFGCTNLPSIEDFYFPELENPLAVAFEISWIMDRIITQPREKEEWKKVLAYEMKRFGGLSSYPENPYYGAKYLITTPNDRNNLCHLSVINRNISEILELSSLSRQKAYERIKSLA